MIKKFIKQTFKASYETYGYRRIWLTAQRAGFHYAPETIRRLMGVLGLKSKIYNKHYRKYSSFRGHVGKIAPNILKQHFNETKPYRVLHTDVTQVKLTNQHFGYISVIIDEASNEVLSAVTSAHPAQQLIDDTLQRMTLPDTTETILHSDQGWMYQLPHYQRQLQQLHITQSMSRKGNCHDNAPVESFFSLLKRECLNRIKINSVTELASLVDHYVIWFNNERISLNKNGLTPVEYRNQTIY